MHLQLSRRFPVEAAHLNCSFTLGGVTNNGLGNKTSRFERPFFVRREDSDAVDAVATMTNGT